MSTPNSHEDTRQAASRLLAEYVEENRDRLLSYIRRRMGDHLQSKVEPDDVLQEAILTAMRSGDPKQHDIYRWLCQFIEWEIIRCHRRLFECQKRDAGREVALHQPAGDATSGGLDQLLALTQTTPSQKLSRDRQEQMLADALGELNDYHRQVVQLRFFEGLTSSQIAARLDKSEGSIRVVISRVLANLRGRLGA